MQFVFSIRAVPTLTSRWWCLFSVQGETLIKLSDYTLWMSRNSGALWWLFLKTSWGLKQWVSLMQMCETEKRNKALWRFNLPAHWGTQKDHMSLLMKCHLGFSFFMTYFLFLVAIPLKLILSVVHFDYLKLVPTNKNHVTLITLWTYSSY